MLLKRNHYNKHISLISDILFFFLYLRQQVFKKLNIYINKRGEGKEVGKSAETNARKAIWDKGRRICKIGYV